MDEIESAYIQKNYELLINLLSSYVQTNDNDNIAKANFYLGSYHEFYDESESCYLTAAQFYRRAIKLSPKNYFRLGLVALLIKSKSANFNEVKQLLDDVSIEMSAAIVDLGYGALFFYSNPPDYRQSKMYFIKVLVAVLYSGCSVIQFVQES